MTANQVFCQLLPLVHVTCKVTGTGINDEAEDERSMSGSAGQLGMDYERPDESTLALKPPRVVNVGLYIQKSLWKVTYFSFCLLRSVVSNIS